MRSLLAVRSDRGSVTAEFATVLPAVLLMLVLIIGVFQGVSQQLRVVDAAAVAARSVARGESVDTAKDRVTSLIGSHDLTSSSEGEFVCVSLSSPVHVLSVLVGGIILSARSCSLAGGL